MLLLLTTGVGLLELFLLCCYVSADWLIPLAVLAMVCLCWLSLCWEVLAGMPRPLLTAWSFSFLVGCSPCSGRAGQSDMSGCLVWIGWSHLHASCRRGIWFWPCYASQLFVSGCHGLSLPLPLTLLVFKAYSCFERHVATEWPYGLHSVTFVLPGCFAAKSLLLALLLLPSCYMVMIFLDCCLMM